MGVTDFDHILFITSNVRKVLGLELQPWNVSIADPPNTPMGTYLEVKSRTGPSIDKLSYAHFLKQSSTS